MSLINYSFSAHFRSDIFPQGVWGAVAWGFLGRLDLEFQITQERVVVKGYTENLLKDARVGWETLGAVVVTSLRNL